MAFRDELAAARARIAVLEEENAELRRRIARLSGEAPLDEAPPPAIRIGESIWSPGSSWMLGWAPPIAAYTGEHDDKGYLRFVEPGRAVLADHALAGGGASQVTRVRDGIVAPLADRSLAFIQFPGHAITRRLALPVPLIAAPIERADGELLAVTAERELLQIDPRAFRVVARRPVDVPELAALGFPDGDARARHNGYTGSDAARSMAHAGWSLEGVRGVGDFTLCAFDRSFAGNEQVAAGVVGPDGTPLWFEEAGGGSMMYLYGVDGVLVLHNVSLEVEPEAWGFAITSGKPVFRIRGRGSAASLEVYDERGAIAVRTSV